MRKYLAALLMTAFVLVAAASVSWGEPAPTSDGGTWESLGIGLPWE